MACHFNLVFLLLVPQMADMVEEVMVMEVLIAMEEVSLPKKIFTHVGIVVLTY